MTELEEEDTIIEEREELMVSPSGEANPTLRIAHFLKPSLSSIKPPPSDLPSAALNASPINHSLSHLPLKVSFKGDRKPMMKWKEWVTQMHSLHQSTWKKAGVYESIINSTLEILIHSEIVLGFAAKWCSETNSFVFPFAEASITLEDVLILGGYSVFGNSVLTPLKIKGLIETEQKLLKKRREMRRSKYYGYEGTHHQEWIRCFMGSGSEVEHEAFLVLWLSRHVFPKKCFNLFDGHAHSIAIYIARGTRVALAPAVLSCLYRELKVLKQAILASGKMDRVIDLWAPFLLVQIWAYERFPTLCAQPTSHELGLPRMARWNKVRKPRIKDVGLVIDSAEECFCWRPYAICEKVCLIHKLYKEREEWVSVDSTMDEDLESFARFLRPSELVGLDCIEQYLPHRVAMQFGMDQDVPGHVARFNRTPEIAWGNYTRPIIDAKLYVPSRLFKSDVTTRYMEWWKQLVLHSMKNKVGHDALVPLGPHPIRKRTKLTESVQKDRQTHVRSDGHRMTGDGKPFLRNQSLTANSGAGEVGRSQMKPGENANQSLTANLGAGEEGESQMKPGENARGDEVLMGPLNQSIANATVDSNEGETDVHHVIEFPELEARISQLEAVVARLKAEKLGRGSA